MNVEIKWETGKMNLYLEFFFPASKDKLNHLLKLIRLDYAHETEIISTILKYLHDEIPVLTDLGRKNAKLYFDSKQKYADYSAMISSRKRPNGLPLTSSEIKQMEKDRAAVKKEITKHETNFKRCKSRIEKIQRNIEQIELKKGR